MSLSVYYTQQVQQVAAACFIAGVSTVKQEPDSVAALSVCLGLAWGSLKSSLLILSEC